jgi:hypothetical protein
MSFKSETLLFAYLCFGLYSSFPFFSFVYFHSYLFLSDITKRSNLKLCWWNLIIHRTTWDSGQCISISTEFQRNCGKVYPKNFILVKKINAKNVNVCCICNKKFEDISNLSLDHDLVRWLFHRPIKFFQVTEWIYPERQQIKKHWVEYEAYRIIELA